MGSVVSAGAVCVRSEREKLRAVSVAMRADIEGRRQSCARSVEWAAMDPMARMAVLLLAGVDGELSQLARRAWPELTPAEKLQCQLAIRSLHAAMGKTYALRLRMG